MVNVGNAGDSLTGSSTAVKTSLEKEVPLEKLQNVPELALTEEHG